MKTTISSLKLEKEEAKKQEANMKTLLDSEKTKQRTELSAKDAELLGFFLLFSVVNCLVASKKELQELKDKISKESSDIAKLLQTITAKDTEIQTLKSELDKLRSSASNGFFKYIFYVHSPKIK